MKMQQNNHLPLTTLVKRMLDIPVVDVYLLVLIRLVPEPIHMGLQCSVGLSAG